MCRSDQDHAASCHCILKPTHRKNVSATQIEMVIDGRTVGYVFNCDNLQKAVIFKGWPAEPGALPD